jgi:hypothetical protein
MRTSGATTPAIRPLYVQACTALHKYNVDKGKRVGDESEKEAEMQLVQDTRLLVLLLQLCPLAVCPEATLALLFRVITPCFATLGKETARKPTIGSWPCKTLQTKARARLRT